MPHRLYVVLACGTVLLSFASTAGAVLDGAGFFEPIGEGYGRDTTFQVVLGDLDGDGDLDAVFANQGRFPSRVLLNDGAGVFTYTDQELTGNGHGAELGDLDGDGDLDLVITCAQASGISKPSKIYLNDGHGTFTDSGQDLDDTALSGNLVQLVDIDVDGDLDVFIAYLTVPNMDFISRIYLNDGAGTFSLSDYAFPYETLFSDLDLDGDADAFTKVNGDGYRALTNDGFGGFEESWRLDDATVHYEPWNVSFGDIDGDGDIDILDTNGAWSEPGPPRVLLADGVGGYALCDIEMPAMNAAWPILADFDGDGHIDVFLSLVADADQLWLGDGSGGFTDSGVRLGRADSRGAAAGDLDGDGDLDLFVPVYGMTGGPNLVWRNVVGD